MRQTSSQGPGEVVKEKKLPNRTQEKKKIIIGHTHTPPPPTAASHVSNLSWKKKNCLLGENPTVYSLRHLGVISNTSVVNIGDLEASYPKTQASTWICEFTEEQHWKLGHVTSGEEYVGQRPQCHMGNASPILNTPKLGTVWFKRGSKTPLPISLNELHKACWKGMKGGKGVLVSRLSFSGQFYPDIVIRF